MDKDFERYIGGPNVALSQRLHVTISPQKLILLNRNMYVILGCPAAVYLNYSRERSIIAIQKASIRVPESFPVVKNVCNWRINAAPFCRHFRIEIDTTLKFIHPELIDETLYLKLNETVSVGGRKRRKKE